MTLNIEGELINGNIEITNEVGGKADVLAVLRSIAPVNAVEAELELAA